MSGRRIARRRLVVALAAVLGAMALGACATTRSTSTAPTPSAAFPTPLATSIATSQGTWATVAMGHLSDPNNTFWQLLYRPDGSTAWSNQVQATATATNGGLVLANGTGRQLVVGIRPSQNLHFTPLIATADAGRSWTNGLLDAGLAASPTALAVSQAGGTLAIVADNVGQSEVIANSGGLSAWRTLVTASDLASQPAGRSCAPSRLNAVAYLGTSILVGASCSQPGASAVFVSQGAGWQTVGPHIAVTAPIEVLGFDPGSNGVITLLGDAGRAHAQLMASWTSNGTAWDASAPLSVPAGDHLVSYGPAGKASLFVLLSGPDDSKQLDQITEPGGGWTALPPPPPSTATVSPAGNGLSALAVNDTMLTIWTLGASGRWASTQSIQVPIQFGSSS